jgi:nucleoside-diphosphate-sugar epimerase
MRVVITGGAGFIGSHTVEEFLNNGYEVVVVDNLRTGSLDNIKHMLERITFIEADICDESVLTDVIKEGDVVVHLAALVSVPESLEHPDVAHKINVTGAHNVFVAAKNAKAKKIVSASSAAVYGNTTNVPTPESELLRPLSPYALHKSINEQYGELFAAEYGLPSVFLRFFNVYGPRQRAEGGYASVIPLFIKKIKEGTPATINGSGAISRDFIFVKDIAEAIRLSAEAELEETFNVFNVATGKPTTLDTLWNTLCSIEGKEIAPIYGPKREADIEVSIADVRKIKEKVGFEAKTPLEVGLRAILEV